MYDDNDNVEVLVAVELGEVEVAEDTLEDDDDEDWTLRVTRNE